MPAKQRLSLLLLLLSILLSACAVDDRATPTAQPSATAQPTPDPCAPENISGEVEKMHKIMREFDDETVLAQYTPREQLNPNISNLQRIRREAEDQPVPSCLVTLKGHQLAHMNTVIKTFLGLRGGVDVDEINQDIMLARQQHDAYILERANLLGLTVPAIPTGDAGQGTSVLVFNPGPDTVALFSRPDENAPNLGFLDIGETAIAVGRDEDGTWIQVTLPDQPKLIVWLRTEAVQMSASPDSLPVGTPDGE